MLKMIYLNFLPACIDSWRIWNWFIRPPVWESKGSFKGIEYKITRSRVHDWLSRRSSIQEDTNWRIEAKNSKGNENK